MNKYKIHSFLNKKKIKSKVGKRLSNMKNTLIGQEVDKIVLSVSIKTKRDMQDLITFLQYSTPCFKK